MWVHLGVSGSSGVCKRHRYWGYASDLVWWSRAGGSPWYLLAERTHGTQGFWGVICYSTAHAEVQALWTLLQPDQS